MRSFEERCGVRKRKPLVQSRGAKPKEVLAMKLAVRLTSFLDKGPVEYGASLVYRLPITMPQSGAVHAD